MANQLLLLQDVEDLGRAGDLVSVRPGYARNFLVPQKKAVVADKNTIRLQEKLQAERVKKMEEEKILARQTADALQGKEFTVHAKMDPDGQLFGSVTIIDLVKLIQKHDFKVEKRHLQLASPIKAKGSYPLVIKFDEGIMAEVTIHILPEVK
jgi:large subunit ribosomal protein L9